MKKAKQNKNVQWKQKFITIVILTKQYQNTSASINIQQYTHDRMPNVSHLSTVNQRT